MQMLLRPFLVLGVSKKMPLSRFFQDRTVELSGDEAVHLIVELGMVSAKDSEQMVLDLFIGSILATKVFPEIAAKRLALKRPAKSESHKRPKVERGNQGHAC